MASAQYPPGSNHVQHRSPFDPGERWFSAKWSWFVATYEARHQAGQARGDGSLGPVSRADHPVATWYNRRGIQQEAQAADLDLGSVRYIHKFARTRKTRLVRLDPRVDESVLLPRGLPSLPPAWRDAGRFLSNESSIHHMPRTIHRPTIFIGRNCLATE